MFNADMQYRYMGKSGLQLSVLGLGGWTTYGANNPWQLGTPADDVINSAYDGTSAWATNTRLRHRARLARSKCRPEESCAA